MKFLMEWGKFNLFCIVPPMGFIWQHFQIYSIANQKSKSKNQNQ
jgi:hypothetical protein